MGRPTVVVAVVAAMVATVVGGLVSPTASSAAFQGEYFAGTSTSGNTSYFANLDLARRFFSPVDTELMTLSSVYDPVNNGLVEGAQWSGNFWTQNSYGFAFAALPFLSSAQRTWLQRSMLWWFDHEADGGQTFGGLPGVPAGILCDNGSPSGCNYEQCGPSRNAKLGARFAASGNASRLDDTAGVGKDFIIEGTLAGLVMQAEQLLITRNASGYADHFHPLFLRISNFMESRRVRDNIPGTAVGKGMFMAGNGANLLAPSYGGFLLPPGCIVTGSFSNCTNRAYAWLVPLTITYSAGLDRLIELELLAYPNGGHTCTTPNADAAGPSECVDLYRARRLLNDETVAMMLAPPQNATNNNRYFVRSIDPDGTRHGVLGQPKYAFFESAPNHDAIALRVVDRNLSSEIYGAMMAIPQLRPCDFTVPNWPDYDDSCGSCITGYGTWVSGGSWSTAEGRAILAHLRENNFDAAERSMARIIYPYAQLFKLDNPIGDTGCGIGMYSVGPRSMPVILDIDIFAIPSAFVRGLFEYQYQATNLTLYPHFPPNMSQLQQNFPVVWGDLRLFLSMSGVPGANISQVLVNGTACAACIVSGDEPTVQLDYASIEAAAKKAQSAAVEVEVVFGGGAGGGGGSPAAAWAERETARQLLAWPAQDSGCSPNSTIAAQANHTQAFAAAMAQGGAILAARHERQQAVEYLQGLNATVTRCLGRASGAIKPIPPQPADWAKYNMTTSQTAADASFMATAQRLYTGLQLMCQSYQSSTDATEQAIYKIWAAATGGLAGSEEAAALGREARETMRAAERRQLRASIVEAQARLAELEQQMAALQ